MSTAIAIERAPADDVRRVQSIARFLDRGYVDPILGFLIPGGGDAIGAVFGLYVVVLAWSRKLPKVVIARMLVNLAVDTAVGAVPLLGDIFDFAFKAHSKNAALFVQRYDDRRSSAGDYGVVLAAAALLILALIAPFLLLAKIIATVGW